MAQKTHRISPSLALTALALLFLGAGESRTNWIEGQDAELVLGEAVFATVTSGLSGSELDLPKGVALDPTTGNVFVADTNNQQVFRFEF